VAELGGQRFSYALEVRHAESEQAVVVEEEHLTVGEILVYRFVGGEVQLFGDDGAAKPRTSFPFAPTRSFLPLLEPRPDNQLIMKFRRWLGGIWLFSIQPQLIAGVSESEDRVLARDGSNFASWYRMLAQEKPEVREALRRDLAPFFPGLSEVRLLSSGRTAKRMNLEFEIGGRRFPLEPAELSDGQRALMVLYTIRHAIADGASLLFFDEPDNYLAQREIQPLLAELTGAARNAGATLLVISHHPEVIDYLAPDQVLRLWRGEDGPTRIESVQFDLSMGMTASETLGLEAI
jgi:hypothetical protein